MRKVAALCVSRGSVYFEIEGVDAYDIERDVRTFQGGMPVVAHPPCRAWSAQCRHQAKPLPGEKELALLCHEHLLANGGILEHPAHSTLYDELDLPKPGSTKNKWGQLWSAQVRQSWWGDPRDKKTWLTFYGIDSMQIDFPFALTNRGETLPAWNKMSKNQRAATSRPMAEWLVAKARLARIFQDCS